MGLEHFNVILRWLNVEVRYMSLKNNALEDTLAGKLANYPSHLPGTEGVDS